jgi:hypothetical protein
MRKALIATIAASALAAICTSAEAITVGLPIFTTTPGTINVVNEFVLNRPGPFYTLSYSGGTIASAEGAPELVGQPISFSFSTDREQAPISIGGVDLAPFPGNGSRNNTLLIRLPIDSQCDASGNCTDTFSGIFTGFNPVPAFIDIQLLFTLSALLPTTTGYFFCLDSNPSDCTQVSDPTLTQLGGQPGFIMAENYIEGQLRNATITFSTVDGRPVSPVPLPATAWLLMAGLAGLGGMARRKLATAA